MLGVGDRAPDFELKDQFGSLVTLEGSLSAGDLVLYFYPADFTPGCTAEACAFRDSFEDLSQIRVQVVGVSPQDTESHRRFAEAYALPFPLLADPDRMVIQAYGVEGPFGIGVRRVTFLIDRTKTIRNRVVADLFLGKHRDLIAKVLEERSPP